MAGPEHGFLRSADGSGYQLFDVPGAVQTMPVSISGSGLIAGTYVDSSNVTHGFIATSALVPEPSSLALCGVAGLAGLAVARVRRGRPA